MSNGLEVSKRDRHGLIEVVLVTIRHVFRARVEIRGAYLRDLGGFLGLEPDSLGNLLRIH
jgi:hypothetical protein